MKINKYEDIKDVANEAKKDLIDRHSPFISVLKKPNTENEYQVEVKVGNEYTHPDDLDHYVSSISLYAGTTKIADANFYSGTLGGQGRKGQAKVVFDTVFEKSVKLTAHAYCTKHGVWEGEPVGVIV